MMGNNSIFFFFFSSQMIYLGLLGHSHSRRLLRHWHPDDNFWPMGLPGHTHILQYMHNDITDETHYTHITTNHPHLGAILITWGDNDIDQPGDTINDRVTLDIVRSLISLLLFFVHHNIAVFIIPPLTRSIPSLTTSQHYRTAATYITHALVRYITDLKLPYTPLISLPSLSMADDGIHLTHQIHMKP